MTDISAASAPTAPTDNSIHYGIGGPLGKPSFARPDFDRARTPYYVHRVIYRFASYFPLKIMRPDILASG